MIPCHKCNQHANPFNTSPEMRECLFGWCDGCDIIVIPLINYIGIDLNRELCRDAHRGTSFSPDVRAQQEIDGYMAEMEAVSARFAPFATPENEKALRSDLEKYRIGYLKRLTVRLAAKARCMSTMIAGPSNFNHRRNEKANNTEHRRTTELLEWRKKALSHLDRDYNPATIARRPIRSDEADAIEQLQAKIEKLEENHRLMKAVNRIARNKKLDNDQKVAKIGELGLSDEMIRDFRCGDEGRFPSFTLTNNNANIKRVRARVTQLEAESDRPEVEDRETTINGTPVTIVENRDESRLQLIFNGKPPKEIIITLKANGFKWSRTNKAWQRLLNDNARRTVKILAS